MQNINFATATQSQLEAAGYIVIVKKSQAKTRRTKKSAWGARPSMNRAGRNCVPMSHATETPKNTSSMQG